MQKVAILDDHAGVALGGSPIRVIKTAVLNRR